MKRLQIQEKQLLASENVIEKRVLDVNALAIFLVKDHNGNEFVSPLIEVDVGMGIEHIQLSISKINCFLHSSFPFFVQCSLKLFKQLGVLSVGADVGIGYFVEKIGVFEA